MTSRLEVKRPEPTEHWVVQPSSVAWNSVLMETPDLHFLSCAAQPKCCYYPSQSGESHSPPYFESSLSLQAPLKGPISQHLLLQRRNRVSLIRCPLFLSLSFHPPSSLFHLSLFTYLFLSLSLHASLSLYITLSIYPSLPLSCLSFHPPTVLTCTQWHTHERSLFTLYKQHPHLGKLIWQSILIPF